MVWLKMFRTGGILSTQHGLKTATAKYQLGWLQTPYLTMEYQPQLCDPADHQCCAFNIGGRSPVWSNVPHPPELLVLSRQHLLAIYINLPN